MKFVRLSDKHFRHEGAEFREKSSLIKLAYFPVPPAPKAHEPLMQNLNFSSGFAE